VKLARVVIVVAAAVAAGVLEAQQPAERARLDSLRTALAAYRDSVTLLARERARIQVARTNRDDPFIHMELGFLAFRLGEITGGKSHYEDAAGEFQWATELMPAWAYAWYWLGVAELNIGENDMIVVENIRQVLGLDHLSKAARSFARAIEADPGFTAALLDLASTTLQQRARGRVMVAVQALRNAAATPAGSQPAVWLMRGRLERRIGAGDSALAAFRRYLALGGDRGVGGVEVARALAALNRGDSALTAYGAAIRAPVSDSARAEIRRDLAWIADPAELRAFDALLPESVTAHVQHFWSRRDVDDARRPGERLLEQFRRYAHATANFQLVSRRRNFHIAFALHDTTQAELDDRGVIYMRHGAPSERARYTPPGTGSEPNESWIYRRQPPEQDLIFHFAAIGDVQDYRLVESLAHVCIQGRLSPDPRLEDQAGRVDPGCYAARARFAEVYDRLQHASPLAASYQTLLAAERDLVRRAVRTGTTSDSYRFDFEGDLRPVISLFVVGDAARRPQVHVVFAVPAGRLHPLEAGGGVMYPLNLRVVIFDTAGREIVRLDTLRTFRAAAALGGGSYLTERMVLMVPPGTWRAHVVIEEGRSGFGTMVRDQRVDAYAMDRGFAVSDVVVGREGSGLVWRRRDGAGDVALNPLGRFPEGGAALLYYELYGLPAGASVETRVTLRPMGGQSVFRRLLGRRSGADLSYTTVTDTDGRMAVRQRLDLTGVRAGRYSLELTLTDPATGRRVTRTDRFEIGGRAP
jgi:GWxTD domain-containing protein